MGLMCRSTSNTAVSFNTVMLQSAAGKTWVLLSAAQMAAAEQDVGEFLGAFGP